MEYDDDKRLVVSGGFPVVNSQVCGPGAGASPELRAGASTACLCLFVRVGEHAPSRARSAEAQAWRTDAWLNQLGWVKGEGGGGHLVPPPNTLGNKGLGPYRPPPAAAVGGKAPRRRSSSRR